MSAQKQYEITQKYIQLLGIHAPSPDQLVKNLSGGNQQKVILARWLATQPQILILDEPTRGIDVGAKAEIQKLVLNLAKEGMSIVSSELEEVLRISHRIVVLPYEGPNTPAMWRSDLMHPMGIYEKHSFLKRIRESRPFWPLVDGLDFVFDALFCLDL